MEAIHKTRLLNVARALRESPNPEKFDMSWFGHSCGSPACALGHYAARPDLQSEFFLRLPHVADNSDDGSALVHAPTGEVVWQDSEEVADHFGLDRTEALELFEVNGCGRAKSALEAAEYIEEFVARKEAPDGSL